MADPIATVNADELLGKVLDGRYRIDSVLGYGGFGMVFRGVQTSIQRPIAIKTLRPHLAMEPTFFERFKREAETASRLRHPNIITIFDFGRTSEGLCYFVMELLEGESLRERVRRVGPMTLREAAAVIEQVALGVGHAHHHNVIHRDLKPHNIMLSEVDGSEYVKVLDFGLVKAIEQDDEEQLTSTGQVLGTPQYISPEQAGGDVVDRRSDLFSLTAVFYYCLTGRSPYGANNVMKALTLSMAGNVAPVDALRQGAPVPEAIDRFIIKGLSPEKEARFESAEEFITALKAAVAGVPDAVLDAVPVDPGASNAHDGIARAPPDAPLGRRGVSWPARPFLDPAARVEITPSPAPQIEGPPHRRLGARARPFGRRPRRELDAQTLRRHGNAPSPGRAQTPSGSAKHQGDGSNQPRRSRGARGREPLGTNPDEPRAREGRGPHALLQARRLPGPRAILQGRGRSGPQLPFGALRT